MATSNIAEKVLEQLERLSPEDQHRVLDFAVSLSRPKGNKGSDLLRLVGAIPADDLDKMEQAIDEPVLGCERIESSEW